VFCHSTAVYYYCDGIFYKCGGISSEELPFSFFFTAVYFLFTAVFQAKMGNYRQLLPIQQNLLALFVSSVGADFCCLPAFISSLPDNFENEGISFFLVPMLSIKLPLS